MLNRSSCLAILQASLKPFLVNFISKDTHLVFSNYQWCVYVLRHFIVQRTYCVFARILCACTTFGVFGDTISATVSNTVNPVLSGHSNRTPKIVFRYQLFLNAGQKYCRMLQREHSAMLSTLIKLPFSIKTFVFSIFK